MHQGRGPDPEPPAAHRWPVPPPPPESWRRPVRYEYTPDGRYRLAIVGSPASVAGPAVGALVAGVGSLLVTMLLWCLGLAGARGGWGLFAGGAFAVLAGLLGLAGVGLGLAGLDAVRRSGRGVDEPRVGRGVAIAGIASGGVGVGLTGCALGAVALVQLG